MDDPQRLSRGRGLEGPGLNSPGLRWTDGLNHVRVKRLGPSNRLSSRPCLRKRTFCL